MIVATACMRYVSTYHHLHAPCSDGHGCVQACCRGVSGRNRGCVVVVLTYVLCVLGNLPSFYLFRATPLSTASLFKELTTTTAVTTTNNASYFVGDPQLMTFSVSDDVWIDFAAIERNLSDSSSSNFTVGSAGSTGSPPGQNNEYLLIDLGPFSHVTRPGYIFHWIKSAMGFFIPGVLLTFFNIRLIQALRRSERLRRDATQSSLSGTNLHSLTVETPKTTRDTVSRNRLNATLVAVIVMLVLLVYPCEFLDFVVHLAPLGKTTTVDEEAMMLTRMILNALQLSNFALNFFLYCTLNAQFRRAFVDWFCRRVRRRRDVRRAALGADAGPRRRDNRDNVVRLNAAAPRHQPRHDDVRTNELSSPSKTLLKVSEKTLTRPRRKWKNCSTTTSERTSFGQAASTLEVRARRWPTSGRKATLVDTVEVLMRCRGSLDHVEVTLATSGPYTVDVVVAQYCKNHPPVEMS